MKQRKIPMRMCAVTRERFPKGELIRIVKTPEDNVELDLTGKKNGRGVYLKNDSEVFKKVIDKKILDKLFETEVSIDVYESLMNMNK